MMNKRSFVVVTWCLLLLGLLACGIGGNPTTDLTASDNTSPSDKESTKEPSPLPPTATSIPTENPYEGPAPDGALARIGRGTVSSMSLSPDGRFLAVGSTIGVYLYRADWMVTDWYTPLNAPVLGTAFAPDGSRLAALTQSHIYVLDTETGKLMGERMSNSDLDGVAIFSPDGTLLVTTSNELVRLWDLASGEKIGELVGHSKAVNSLVWTPDGNQLVSGATAEDGESGEIIVWNVAAGEIVHQFGSEHSRAITDLVFNADGSLLLSDAAKEAIIWEFDTGTPLHVIESTHFASADWAQNDAWIAFGLNQGRTVVYDATNFNELYQVEDQRITILDVAFSQDGSLLYTLDSDGTIYKRDAATGQKQLAAEGFAGRLGTGVWSPDGATLWAGMSGSQIVNWDVNTYERLHLYGDFGSTGLIGATIEAMAFSPDYSLIAIGDLDGQIQLYDPVADEVVAIFGNRDIGHASAINNIGWSPDGTQIVTGSLDNSIIIWDVAAESPAVRFDDFSERGFGGAAFSPDGSAVVVAGWDDSLYVLDPASGLVTKQWNPDLGDQSDLDWHPTQPTQFVTACGMDVILWDSTTGEQMLVMDAAEGFDFPYAVAFSPDGSFIIGGGSRGDVAIWDAATGSVVAVFEGPHTDSVSKIAFSPDGTKFATISHDGTIVVWPVP